MEEYKNIYSNLQFVALEIAKFVGEPEKMGLWIGVVKKIGTEKSYAIMSQMKQQDERNPIKSRARYFMSVAFKTKQ